MNRIRHTAIVLALIGFSAAVQYVTISRAIVPAQDAIRYATAAQAYSRHGIWESLVAEPEPPLFPILANWTHRILTHYRLVVSWATSLQVAAAIPLVLAVVPVYLLSFRWLGGRAAISAGVLFVVLRETARLGADGISDSTHLFWACMAFWASVVFLTHSRRYSRHGVSADVNASDSRPRRESPSPLWLLLAGLASGMALLVRPEILLFLGALTIVLPMLDTDRTRQQRMARLAVNGGCLALGLSAIVVPYTWASGARTASDITTRLLGLRAPRDGMILNDAIPTAGDTSVTLAGRGQLPDETPLKFSHKGSASSSRFRGLPAAIAEYLREIGQAFQFWVGGLALVGVLQSRQRWSSPASRFGLLFFVLFSIVAIAYASRVGYLSGRHLLLLVLVGIPWAGRGAEASARRVHSWLNHFDRRRVFGGCLRRRHVFAVVVVLIAAGCLTVTARPLHATRAAHREAADWLTAGGRRSGAVLDSRGWTGLYSGRRTYLCDAGFAALADTRLAFIVLEPWELAETGRRGRTLRYLMDTEARRVVCFGDSSTGRRPPVVVYQWNPNGRYARQASTERTAKCETTSAPL